MADQKISEMGVATLSGTEMIEVVQGGVNKRTDPAAIAALAAGGVSSVNGQTGAVTGLGEIAQRIDQNNSATTSAQLAATISDETGSGLLVFGTSPTLITPALGTPSAVVLTNGTGLPGTAVINTPAGGIAATTAQAAINELDTDKTDQISSFRTVTGSHTLDATDLAALNAGDDYVLIVDSASASDVTIPLNATIAFAQGMKFTIFPMGVGQVSIVLTGGVTGHTSSGDYLSRNQYAPIFMEVLAVDEWSVVNGTTPGSIVSSGTYTPTLTNTTNIAASTAYACQYMRVGATVTVSGKVSIDPTSTGDTVLGMSIPIPSAFSQEFHAGGVAAAYAVAGLSAAILADATNDRLTIRLTAVDTTNRDFFFSATYQIL